MSAEQDKGERFRRSANQGPGGRIGLGAGLFFALLAAALVCAVLVVRARSPDLVLEVTQIEPRSRVIASAGSPDPGVVEFELFVRESDSAASVEVVDGQEDTVAVLDPEVALEADEPVTYEWDGLTEASGPAPPGRYRLRVVLPEHDRQMVWPQRVTVVHRIGAANTRSPG